MAKVFNINHSVKVKLTDYGLEKWKEYNDQFLFNPEHIKPLSYYKERENKDGYYEFQMWNLMQIFGSYIGFSNLPFDTNFIIEDKDLNNK